MECPKTATEDFEELGKESTEVSLLEVASSCPAKETTLVARFEEEGPEDIRAEYSTCFSSGLAKKWDYSRGDLKGSSRSELRRGAGGKAIKKPSAFTMKM